MHKAGKTGFFSLLLVATLLTHSAGAALLDFLPESSYYQGRSYFGTWTADGFLSGRIEFAVYDTLANPDEFVGADGFENPGDGQYVYAYQILSDELATAAVDFFAILGIGENALTGPGDINSQDDLADGIQPDFEYLNPDYTKAIWEFEGGFLVAGEHSWFLVMSSDNDWTVGSYTFDPTEVDGTPVPNPEPATIALLGLGGLITLIKRKSA